MLFQRKINRIFSKAREKREQIEAKQPEAEELPLEAKDFFAMLLSAFMVIFPVVLTTLAILTVIGYFFFFH